MRFSHHPGQQALAASSCHDAWHVLRDGRIEKHVRRCEALLVVADCQTGGVCALVAGGQGPCANMSSAVSCGSLVLCYTHRASSHSGLCPSTIGCTAKGGAVPLTAKSTACLCAMRSPDTARMSRRPMDDKSASFGFTTLCEASDVCSQDSIFDHHDLVHARADN